MPQNESRNSMIFAAMVVSTLALYLLASIYLAPTASTETKTSNKTSTAATSIGTTNSTEVTVAGGGNQTDRTNSTVLLLNGSATYSQLGYPILTYDGSSHYSPSEPNFTLEYSSDPTFTVGFLEMPVINLSQAVQLAESYAGLSKGNYSLVDADFEPGVVMNDAVASPAIWKLGFAQVVDGYWLYGSADGNGATNVVSLNAISGSITQSTGPPGGEPALGNYAFSVNAPQALALVRGFDLLNLPPGFVTTANVTSIAPRIINLEVSPHTLYLYAPVVGEDRLCWNVSLSYNQYPGSDYQWHASFIVDGQNGELLAESAEDVFQPGPRAVVTASFVSSSAQNLTISQETFWLNTSIVGFPDTVKVQVPNVVVLRPGSTGGLSINFSYDGPAYVVANLDFSILPTNSEVPPPIGLPPGVVVSFSDLTVAVNATMSTTRSIFFAVEEGAPSGTYLVDVNPIFPDPGLFLQLPFLLTVWNSTGQWPSPPSIG